MIDPQFKKHPFPYILQAVLGGLLIAACIYFLDFLLNTFNIPPDNSRNEYIRTYIVGSIAASTFLVFGAPHLDSSKPKKIFWGHFISALIGIIVCFSLFQLKLPSNDSFGIYLGGFLSVSLAIFSMTVLDIEHPPAAGTALAIATHNAQWGSLANTGIPTIFIIALFILFVAAILSFIRFSFYFDNDHLKSIEGLGAKIQNALYIKEITTVSDLYNEEKKEIILQDILLKNHLYKSYCIDKENIDSLINKWISQAEEIKNQKKSRHFLRDLF